MRDVIAEGRDRTYDLGGTAGHAAAFADAIIERLGADAAAHRRRRSMTGICRASLPARRRKPRGHGARPGFGVDAPARSLVGRRPSSRARVFTICATTSFFSGILLDAAVRDAVRGRRLPLAALLAADRAGLAADLVISPGLLILWIPLGFRATCYYYRRPTTASTSPTRRAAPSASRPIHRRYRMETAFPFILQNLHRYFLYLAFVPLFFLWLDAVAVAAASRAAGGSASAASSSFVNARSC